MGRSSTATHSEKSNPYSYLDSFQKFQETQLPPKAALDTRRDSTILLADVFKNFRAICVETYQLDPAHYYNAPGLVWDAAIKFTQIELDTLTDIDHHLFFETGLRAGISMITHGHAEANNSYLEDYYETMIGKR